MRGALVAAVCTSAAAAAAPAKLPQLEWVAFTFHAGHVCEGTAAAPGALCRSYAHTVMQVAPKDVTSLVVGSATYRLDDGPQVQGGPATFERHLVESDGNATHQRLPKGTKAQMWNWGYDAETLLSPSSGGGALPKQICITAAFVDRATGDRNALAETCIPMVLSWAGSAPPPPMATYFQPQISASHAVCGGAHCRTNVHVVFKSRTGGQPTNSMYGGMAVSFDDGPYLVGGTAFYEQHIDRNPPNGAGFYSAMQGDVDLMQPLSAAAHLPKKACFKIWVQDAVTTQRIPLTTGVDGRQLKGPLPAGWVNSSCLAVCRSLHAFHTPYCPS